MKLLSAVRILLISFTFSFANDDTYYELKPGNICKEDYFHKSITTIRGTKEICMPCPKGTHNKHPETQATCNVNTYVLEPGSYCKKDYYQTSKATIGGTVVVCERCPKGTQNKDPENENTCQIIDVYSSATQNTTKTTSNEISTNNSNEFEEKKNEFRTGPLKNVTATPINKPEKTKLSTDLTKTKRAPTPTPDSSQIRTQTRPTSTSILESTSTNEPESINPPTTKPKPTSTPIQSTDDYIYIVCEFFFGAVILFGIGWGVIKCIKKCREQTYTREIETTV